MSLPALALLLLAGGLLFQDGPAIAGAAVCGLAALATAAWGRVGERHLEGRLRLRPGRVFPGETAELTLTLINHGRLPLPWVRFGLKLPAGARVDGRPERGHLTGSTWLGPRQRVSRSWQVRLDSRGRHDFGPLTLDCGDPFGLHPRSKAGAGADLIVYPDLAGVTGPDLTASVPAGPAVVRAWLPDDPLLTRGLREYRPGDALSRAAWKATARAGRLLVRVPEVTVEGSVCLFLDLTTAGHRWEGPDSALAEAMIRETAALAARAIFAGHRAGLVVNTYARGGAGREVCLPAGGHEQLAGILETLASIPPVPFRPVHRLIEDTLPLLSWGTGLVLVAARLTPAAAGSLARAAAAGRRVAVRLAREPGHLPPVHRVEIASRQREGAT